MLRIASVVLALLTLFAGALCCEANLLTNPGFETFPPGATYTGGTHFRDGWRYFSVNGASFTLETTTPAHGGSIALKLTRGNTSGDAGLDRDSTNFRVPVLPNRLYRGSVWARSDSGSRMSLILAPYTSSGTWLQTQGELVFPLSSAYARCAMEYLTPPNTAYLNFAIRVHQTGAIVVDDCELIEVPSAPRITYPVGEMVESLKPVIAFAGLPHTDYQVVITDGAGAVWDSGEVPGAAYSLTCPVSLQPQGSYQVKARIRHSGVWTEFGAPASFTTPSAPVVRITSPLEADSLRGPTVTAAWHAESPSAITSQTISVDGRAPVWLGTSARSYSMANLTEGLHSVTVTATSAEGTVSSTTRFHVRLTPATTGTIYYYDLGATLSGLTLSQRYDVCQAVAALQGLVNRSGPRLFVNYGSESAGWWSRLRESGNWLSRKTVVTLSSGISNLPSLFNTFKADYNGAVLWDPSVYATSNVADTVAGADALIPVRYDPASGSVYSRIIAAGPAISVQVDLRGRFTGAGTIWQTGIPSTGSRKCDAYVWARAQYLETGRCNPALMMYAVDGYWLATSSPPGGNTLVSRDYVIRNKGFFFDLSVWADEKPVDDPNQTLGLDLTTLRSILAAAAARTPGMIGIVGFVPWPFKYTNWGSAGGNHGPVETEWEYARWISHYNGYMDADAYGYVDFPNASLYSQFPLPDRLTQNRRLSHTALRKLGYIDADSIVSPLNYLSIYMGDYDSAAWVGIAAWGLWHDSNRGVYPTSWAFNPNHIDRIAAIYEYYNRTRTINDSFIAGDSGAGYVNPSCLMGTRWSGLPSAEEIWVRHNLDYFRRTNITITGFVLNGFAGPIGPGVDSMYAHFSVDGAFSQPTWYPQGDHMVGSMPALRQVRDLTGNATNDVNLVQPMGSQSGPRFLNFRTVLVSPTYLTQLYGGVAQRDTSIPWAFVDMRTYAALASRYYGHVPDCRATYTFDTIPDTLYAGSTIRAAVGVRNEGWRTWQASGSDAVTLVVTWKQGAQTVDSAIVPLTGDVASGEGAVLEFDWPVPAVSGDYTLAYTMARGGLSFEALGDYGWENEVKVESVVGGTCAGAKALADGAQVQILNAVVTAGIDQFLNTFYIEDESRVSGIQVYAGSGSGISVFEGDRVSLAGVMGSQYSERRITSPAIISRHAGLPLDPIGMGTASAGGAAANEFTPGIPGSSGAHNTGLLVRVWGRVTEVDAPGKTFYLDDGSGLVDSYGRRGVMVRCSGLASGNSIALPAVGQYVAVTGINGRTSVLGVMLPSIRPRKQADMKVLSDSP